MVTTEHSRAELLLELFHAGVIAVSGYEVTRRFLLDWQIPDKVCLVALEKGADSILSIADFLDSADAGSCLNTLEALVTTGPTGTNVMDLAIAILD